MHAEKYATAVRELIDAGKPEDEIVKGMTRALRARGHLRLLPRILRILEQSAKTKNKREQPVLSVACAKDTEVHASAITQSQMLLGIGDKKIETVIDETLVGGYLIRHGSTQIDASYKKALITLYRAVTAR